LKNSDCDVKGFLIHPSYNKESKLAIILLSKEVGQILFLKRGGLFNSFPNLGRKVIKSATNEEICFLKCPS
jgi:hypothetical protein